jgi:hypothetical protein
MTSGRSVRWGRYQHLSFLIASFGLIALAILAAALAFFGHPKPAKASGAVMWNAGAEKPLYQEWAELSTQDHCAVVTYPGITSTRISRVTHPVARGTYAYRAFLKDGDKCFNERAEMGQGNPTRSGMGDRLFRPGEERWISFYVRPSPSVPLHPGTWQLLMQIKQIGRLGSPIMELDIDRGQWMFRRTTNDPNNQFPSGFRRSFALGPAKTNKWAHFLMHVYFSSNPRVGYVRIDCNVADGQGMHNCLPFTRMATMKRNNGQTVNDHARLGIYRDSRINGNAVAFYDGYTVARTRNAALSGQ